MRGARWAAAALAAAGWTSAGAQTLVAAFESAARHDPAFHAARAELDAARQLLPIARAARLPSVNASISDAKVEGTREVPGLLGPSRSGLDYRSPNYAFSIRIPVLNAEALHGESLARAQVQQAEHVFRARRLELWDRTATAWLSLRKAEQLAALAAAPVQAAASLAEQSRGRLGAGETTRMDVADAEAALAQALALEGRARSAVAIARLTLEQLIGGPTLPQRSPTAGEPLSAPSAAWPGTDEPIESAVQRAKASHPAVSARRQGVAAAAAAVRRNEAGHLPRADLVLSASTARNDSVSTLNQAISQRVFSAQLNLPLYSGGQVLASVARASAELRQAEAELAAEEQAVEREVTRLHLTLRDQDSRWKAQLLAIEAAQLGLRALRLAQSENLATRSDVDQAVRRLEQERQALVEIAYEGSLAWLRLRAQLGDELHSIASAFDAWLRASR